MIILFKVCSKYFDWNCDSEECQVGSLTILPKKGDLTNSNNWRGINLLDAVSKTISIVIASRLLTLLLVQGISTHFGSTPKTGCPDGSFLIRTLLQMREKHTLNPWVVFVDLIEASDSIHHELLFILLKKTQCSWKISKYYQETVSEFQNGN